MNNNDEIEKIIDGIDLSKSAPEEEPQRQYYFIKKARQIVKKRSEEIGRPLFCNIVTFGWPMDAI